ncbi:hypothetical protein [Blastopirellula marina]|uniref:Uncharacterized protein n=1 Tax=Blastopirellula marina TaxID=124 RepID=A0A2S8GRE3_9BACT|nr:hypothetical protein [Blastopirellula marina]PQO46996.1 hypothetical protein C5Y93_05725 [Blastopirellula marina]
MAAPPFWNSLIPFRRVEADINKSYELTEENGPWMIMASSFSGAGAAQDARDLMMELRREFGVEAYVFKQKYDFSDTVTGMGYDRYGKPKKMRYVNDNSFTSYAVMVGNYDSVDSSGLQKTLEKLKKAEPKVFETGVSVKSDTLKSLRERLSEAIAEEDKKPHGPMSYAFVTRNPLLPEEYFRPQGPDQLVVDMNKDTPYNLLKCPGAYTVKVASFRGAVVIDQKEIKRIEEEDLVSASRLAKAAEKAEKLAHALRQQGVEAYTFHDRTESMVTVGSFDSVGTPRRDGKIEINPQVKRIIDGYKGNAGSEATPTSQATFKPKMLAGITFDVQPIPVQVPRVSIAADYARGVNR